MRSWILRCPLLLTFAVTLVGNCTAQWTLSYRDLDAHFADAAFPTDAIGFVAATDTGGACVLRTRDGGTTWDKQYVAGWSFVDKVAMLDTAVGYLIKGGVPVQILRTTDGFDTWTMHNLDSSFVVESLQLLTDSTGLYLNNGGRLRVFKQYGAHYSYLADSLNGGQNLQLVGPLNGYWDTGNGLLRTADGGNHWSVTNANLGFGCLAFEFWGPGQGYFSDGLTLYKTTNAGQSFTPTHAYPDVYDFATLGPQYCVAANDTGNVAVTLDGGAVWTEEQTGINWIADEPYKVLLTPGGDCFIYCGICGEIRKRPDAVTALEHATPKLRVTAFPNPIEQGFWLSLPAGMQEGRLTITDMTGREWRNEAVAGPLYWVERGELPPGIHTLRLTGTGGQAVAAKIVAK